MSESVKTQSLTIFIPAGRLPLDVMQKAHDLAEKHNFEIYLSVQQNLRLLNVPTDIVDDIKNEFTPFGLTFKAVGQFNISRVCVGAPHCNLGIIDTEDLNTKIFNLFKDRNFAKPKLKISIAACNLGCSGTRTTDIGVEVTRKGFTIYAGGKGGVSIKPGRRIKRDITEKEMLETLVTLFDFHDANTGKKQRMVKLLSHDGFPFPAV